MQLPILLLSLLPAVLATPAKYPTPKPKPPKTDDRLVFEVPQFSSSQTYPRGTVDPNRKDKYINFTVTDVHARTVPNAISTTTCAASFLNPPNATYPASCADPGFSWYFSAWYGIANFTLNIDHSYYDPKVAGGTGLSVTYFGEGDKLVNYDTTQRIFFICAASGAVCAAEFKNETNPIVVPITHAIA